MRPAALHHVTLKTGRLAQSLAFYQRHLGLRPGARPPFDVPGAWLYPEGGAAAILHLIETLDAAGEPPATGMFDHFAVQVADLAAYLDRVRADGAWYRATPVPGTNLVQIHHHDPNGVMIEATFAGELLDPGDVRP
jgi:catechol 2,3-dioxygenase-like lactoylglutathione lyase family enzyme